MIKLHVEKWFLLSKEKASLYLFYASVLILFLWSANVSWMWAFEVIAPIAVAVLLVSSMLISNSCSKNIYSRKDFLFPILFCALAYFYKGIVSGRSLVGYIMYLFSLLMYLALFRLDAKFYRQLATLLCKFMAILLTISMTGFLMYLLGFSLPNHSASWGDYYNYTDYYLFLVDDRAMFDLLPRFHSIFLEPGHMGTIIVLLLATQLGEWNKWYNRIMMVAMFLSFSLAAYGLFVILLFLRLWMLRKNMVRSIVITIAALATIVGGSFVYKQGDNMLNQLIIMRLSINKTGDDFEGNNRVSENFKREYAGFIKSSDILFGRGKWIDDEGNGNAGIKLYIYENGIIGFILIYLFYYIAMCDAKDKRCFWAMIFLSLINFWIRSYPLWFAFYIPYYLMAHQQITHQEKHSPNQNILNK